MTEPVSAEEITSVEELLPDMQEESETEALAADETEAATTEEISEETVTEIAETILSEEITSVSEDIPEIIAEPETDEAKADVTEAESLDEGVFAGEMIVELGKCGENLRWYLYDTGSLRIFGTGYMYDYTYSDSGNTAPWGEFEDDIKSIYIGNQVRTIGAYAFANLYITEAVIPDNIEVIGIGTFASCQLLKSITFPSTLTVIPDYCCFWCFSLESINMPDTVLRIGTWAFTDCYSLSTIPTLKKVHQIDDYAFYGSGINSITMLDTETIGVEAFSCCSDLSSVTLSSTLTKIGSNAFSQCGFSAISLPSGLKTIGDSAFEYCENLKSISIPKLDSFGDFVFYGCGSLVSAKLPENLQAVPAYTFYGCEKLASITIPDTVKSIEKYSFYGCSSLTEFTIPENVEYLGNKILTNCTGISSITFKGDAPTVTVDPSTGDLAEPFYGIQADAYYPVEKNGWNDPQTIMLLGSSADLYWIPVGTLKPGTVTGLKAAALSNGCKLSWDPVDGADGYLIYGIRPGSSYSYIGMTTSGTSYTDTKASYKGWNYYWVYAYVKDYADKMITGDCEKYVYGRRIFTPAPVTNLKAASQTGSVKLTWTASAGATGYLVYGKHGSSGTYGYIGMTTTGTSYIDKKASKTDYNFYWVFPYYKDFNGKMWTGSCPKYVFAKAK